jgi:hypothetical protein
MCCFCGGQTPATETDHQPAKILFPDKRRPKGLEFPACMFCNRQTAADEALLAFVCRFAGSHRPNAARDWHRLKDIVRSVNSAFPGLTARMHPQGLWAPERGVRQRVGALDLNQPEVHQGLCRIAAKLALATYYQTKSVPAAPACRINCQWTHSQNSNTFKPVQNIINSMSNQAALQMGKWTTQESFFFEISLRRRKSPFSSYLSSIGRANRRPARAPGSESWFSKMALHHGADAR